MNKAEGAKSYAGFVGGSNVISSPAVFNGRSLVLNQGGAAPPPYK